MTGGNIRRVGDRGRGRPLGGLDGESFARGGTPRRLRREGSGTRGARRRHRRLEGASRTTRGGTRARTRERIAPVERVQGTVGRRAQEQQRVVPRTRQGHAREVPGGRQERPRPEIESRSKSSSSRSRSRWRRSTRRSRRSRRRGDEDYGALSQHLAGLRTETTSLNSETQQPHQRAAHAGGARTLGRDSTAQGRRVGGHAGVLRLSSSSP